MPKRVPWEVFDWVTFDWGLLARLAPPGTEVEIIPRTISVTGGGGIQLQGYRGITLNVTSDQPHWRDDYLCIQLYEIVEPQWCRPDWLAFRINGCWVGGWTLNLKRCYSWRTRGRIT
jgi:hypothetical protein